jgi:CheY-like chemotaxis protein
MPDGGTLTIETRTLELDQEYARNHADMQPGRYVCLTITDTGTGMDADTRAHIFEPFFTTKTIGEGTGLGLATVYGIVTQSGGHIQVYSEAGLGTSFKVFLPALTGEAAGPTAASQENPVEQLHGTETILLCEDEDGVRRYVELVLNEHGYTVLAATHPTEALQLADAPDRQIDLLITDVIMPGSNGPDLARRLRKLRPDLQVIFVSGYAATSLSGQNLPMPSAFLEKPFQADTLLTLIRSVLGSPSTQPNQSRH